MNLTEARAEYDAVKHALDQELRKIRVQRLAAAKLNMALVAQQLRNEGASISELCRQYGTTDRKTVMDLLNLVPTNSQEIVNPVVTHNADGTVTVSVVNYPPDKWTKKRAKLQAPATPYTGSVTWTQGVPDDPSSPVAHEWPQ